MLENVMESAMSVVLGTNKRYFIENKFLLMDCFYDLKVSILRNNAEYLPTLYAIYVIII